MGYYKYSPWFRLINFISESHEEIVDAVVASNNKFGHDVPIPLPNGISLAEKVNVFCERPCGRIESHILAEIEPDKLSFEVSANAFSYVTKQVYFKKNIIGGMYTFNAGLMGLGQWYFSGSLWQKIRGYDWEQHRNTIESFLEQDEFAMELAEEKGHFMRRKKLL